MRQVGGIRWKRYQRLWVLGLSAFVGLLCAVVPVREAGRLLASPTPVTHTQIAQAAPTQNAQRLLQQGIEHYEAEQFTEAIESWQQAIAISQEPLQQAFAWSNLSLAYQQLGRWSEADQAIRQSLSLLQQPQRQTEQLYQEVLAKVLNTQGRLQWYSGQIDQALETWQQASASYQQAGDRTGLMISLINQARALQTLGFSVRAEAQLTQVEQLLQQETDPNLQATGWRNLGNALRRVGKLQESREVLQTSLQVKSVNPAIQSATFLDLGNTERALGTKALTIGDTESAQRYLQSAQQFYEQAVTSAPSPLAKLQAQLNQLSLLIDATPSNQATPSPQVFALAEQLRSDFADLPLNRASLYARLNYARSLSRAVCAASTCAGGQLNQRALADFLAETLQQARNIGDVTAESYALGQLGELYEQAGQWREAEDLTQQALLKAEALQAADVRYRWEWQLGRLQQQQGNWAAALAAYQAAVKSLQSVRNDLLSISADVQFSFRDDVEPVYRGLVELLLLAEPGQSPSQENLKQAIQQVNALQLAELNNFLGCNLAQTVELEQIEADATAAKLYPMILPNRLAIVLELPGNQPLLYHEVPQSRANLLQTLQQLRRDLSTPDRTPEAVAGLKQLYGWLIAPFQTALEADIKTLVFVLDGELRNIPMAALYNGQQYLVSQYAVAVAPRLELFQPNPRPAKLNVFLGGVGEPQTLQQRAFPKIEYLTSELEQIQKLAQAQQPLLNEAFTESNLEQQLQAGEFSAIHLKTHGIFSSDPEETFIVAYQELITGRDLGRLIQLGRLGEASPIELLVLSACSTAQGDSRAVLGLAGVAVQAGARSVVSTLWEAQDLPNTELMIRFYQELLDPQISRAEALRRAQLHLLQQGYTTPHVWATYVLVGNWL
ncbi:MAG: CHAT domain-containing protein [Elainella sp. C42_A2020_010]|nr:CHAT domain-containing protein [Elainella sp. C42_A2020_010]